MPATYMKLSWSLNLGSQNLQGVMYDIYLDTKNPPQKLIAQNENSTNLWIKDLENEHRYYWTVVPKYNDLNGTCISGVWWFQVEIPIPRAILTKPQNRSIISDLNPTLVWTLDYKGSEPVLYDLYFSSARELAQNKKKGQVKDEVTRPELKITNLTINYITFFETLVDNMTYYWQVVPKVDKYGGIGSPVWSFTIDSVGVNITSFKLELTLDPAKLILEPGDMLTVRAKVKNLGTGPDIASLNFKYPPDKGIGVLINGQNRLELSSGEDDEFELTVVAMISAEPGTVNITVVAYSRTVGYLNETVNSEKLLNVIVRTYHSTNDDPEKDQEPGINTATMISVIIPLIILIIIMAIVLFLAIIANRRKEREEEEEIEEIQEIAEDQILESSEDGKALATAPAQVPTEEETTEE
jgi:hypothetical protein